TGHSSSLKHTSELTPDHRGLDPKTRMKLSSAQAPKWDLFTGSNDGFEASIARTVDGCLFMPSSAHAALLLVLGCDRIELVKQRSQHPGGELDLAIRARAEQIEQLSPAVAFAELERREQRAQQQIE